MCRNEEEILSSMNRCISYIDNAMTIQGLHEVQKKFYTSYKIAVKCDFLGSHLEKLRKTFEERYKRKFSVLCVYIY